MDEITNNLGLPSISSSKMNPDVMHSKFRRKRKPGSPDIVDNELEKAIQLSLQDSEDDENLRKIEQEQLDKAINESMGILNGNDIHRKDIDMYNCDQINISKKGSSMSLDAMPNSSVDDHVATSSNGQKSKLKKGKKGDVYKEIIGMVDDACDTSTANYEHRGKLHNSKETKLSGSRSKIAHTKHKDDSYNISSSNSYQSHSTSSKRQARLNHPNYVEVDWNSSDDDIIADHVDENSRINENADTSVILLKEDEAYDSSKTIKELEDHVEFNKVKTIFTRPMKRRLTEGRFYCLYIVNFFQWLNKISSLYVKQMYKHNFNLLFRCNSFNIQY